MEYAEKNMNPTNRTRTLMKLAFIRSKEPLASYFIVMVRQYGAGFYVWHIVFNCMAHRSFSWRNQCDAAYVFTPDVAQLMEFELWEPIIILDEKTQFPESRKIFYYYAGYAPNKGALN